MGARCECKTSFAEYSTLTDEDRQRVFEAVWKFQWAERKQFILAMTFKKDVSKQTSKDGESRRSDTIIYMLKAKDGKKSGCVKDEYFVRTYADVKEKGPESNTPQNKSNNNVRISVLAFLRTLPVLPSHYCRQNTSKLYLEPIFQSDADVIRLYHEYSSENELKAAFRNVCMDEFKSNNFSTFNPRNDQCDDFT